MNNGTTRRRFIKTGGSLTGLGLLRSRRAWAERSSDSELKVALVGAGGIAKTAFHDRDQESVIAVADVDREQGAPGCGRYPNAKHYKDFRKVLEASSSASLSSPSQLPSLRGRRRSQSRSRSGRLKPSPSICVQGLWRTRLGSIPPRITFYEMFLAGASVGQAASGSFAQSAFGAWKRSGTHHLLGWILRGCGTHLLLGRILRRSRNRK